MSLRLPKLKRDLSDEICVYYVDIDQCDILITFNEMCQHLEDLLNSVNQYFSNDQCMLLQNYAWVKDLT